jgi:hypothetical protein
MPEWRSIPDARAPKGVPLGALLLLAACATAPVVPPTTGDQCLTDVDAAAGLLQRNYAGYQDKVAALGKGRVENNLAVARRLASEAPSDAECDEVMKEWLFSFRDGHVSVHSERPKPEKDVPGPQSGATGAAQDGPDGKAPTITATTAKTIVLRIPTFNLSNKAPLEAILRQSGDEIRRRPILVLDVRGNGGGSDTTYDGLLPLLYAGPIRTVGTDVLATPENANAWERLLEIIPASEEAIRERIRKMVAAMREKPNAFIPIVADETLTLPQVLPRPERVIVLVDGRCASSCEQFLLAARQSRKVTLAGLPSGGVLDYANVRGFPLPSGQRRLSLATSRSRRLPAEPVDGVGIPPQVRIEAAALSKLDGKGAAAWAEQLPPS